MPEVILWGAKDLEILLRAQGSVQYNRDFQTVPMVQPTAEVTGWGFLHRATKGRSAVQNVSADGAFAAAVVGANSSVPTGRAWWVGPTSLEVGALGANDGVVIPALRDPAGVVFPAHDLEKAWDNVVFEMLGWIWGVVIPAGWSVGFHYKTGLGVNGTVIVNSYIVEL